MTRADKSSFFFFFFFFLSAHNQFILYPPISAVPLHGVKIESPSVRYVAFPTHVSMTEPKHAGLSPAFVESVAGLSAGTMATLIVHPLDIVKTRMQSERRSAFCGMP
jgi:hypothetical protein